MSSAEPGKQLTSARRYVTYREGRCESTRTTSAHARRPFSMWRAGIRRRWYWPARTSAATGTASAADTIRAPVPGSFHAVPMGAAAGDRDMTWRSVQGTCLSVYGVATNTQHCGMSSRAREATDGVSQLTHCSRRSLRPLRLHCPHRPPRSRHPPRSCRRLCCPPRFRRPPRPRRSRRSSINVLRRR